jgi:hypothetical protein
MPNDTKIYCSTHFKYEDFFNCSETYQATLVENSPNKASTYGFIRQLANDILEPCFEQFGALQLTYGFCGNDLSRAIRKRGGGIYPPLDQHAGMELNAAGKLICPRGGMAADFHCPPKSSLELAKFIVDKLPFDRLYFYGESRPVHVSVNKKLTAQVVLMQKARTKVVPRRISKSDFLSI